MRDDVLATVCRRKVHGPGTSMSRGSADHQCPNWCDAGWRSTSQFGSPHQAPTQATGSSTVPWDHIQVTGNQAMIFPPIPMVQATLPPPSFAKVVEDAIADYRPEDLMAALCEVAPETPIGRVSDRMLAEAGIAALLRCMGEDTERDGIRDTPGRVVKAFLELADRPGDPEVLLSKQFPEGPDNGEMVTVNGIQFVSICEHHLLPFTGTATVAYIPSGPNVVGLSKIPRLVHHFARRPQVQERLTGQITEALDKHLATNGSACRIESTHQCMALRGVRAQGSAMVTTSLTGRFLEDSATRGEFMAEAMGKR